MKHTNGPTLNDDIIPLLFSLYGKSITAFLKMEDGCVVKVMTIINGITNAVYNTCNCDAHCMTGFV
jgi:hypothetical protein